MLRSVPIVRCGWQYWQIDVNLYHDVSAVGECLYTCVRRHFSYMVVNWYLPQIGGYQASPIIINVVLVHLQIYTTLLAFFLSKQQYLILTILVIVAGGGALSECRLLRTALQTLRNVTYGEVQCPSTLFWTKAVVLTEVIIQDMPCPPIHNLCQADFGRGPSGSHCRGCWIYYSVVALLEWERGSCKRDMEMALRRKGFFCVEC